jgi:hypothetical protein
VFGSIDTIPKKIGNRAARKNIFCIGENVNIKHQLKIEGNVTELRKFTREVSNLSLEEFCGFPLNGDESNRTLSNASLPFDLESIAPLPETEASRQVLAVLDDSNSQIKEWRKQTWGVEEVPKSALLNVFLREQPPGFSVELRTQSGDLVPWVKKAAEYFPDLSFKLLWVRWPGAQATEAGVYFSHNDSVFMCPNPSNIDGFARKLGWVGDYGFNDHFFYASPILRTR